MPTRRAIRDASDQKGRRWYFGMKAHLGVDSRTELIHAVVATPANVAGSTVQHDLLHGQETRVWGDQAYRGQRAVIRQHAPNAQDITNRRYRHRERRELEARTRRRNISRADGMRAAIVLLAADGTTNLAIAEQLGVSRLTVATWRQRFAAKRLDGLADEPRPGAPRRIGDE